jgi:transcriptional regulator NrdR family protein
MICPNCNKKTQIIETRLALYGKTRTRKCIACNHKFSTVEISRAYYESLIDAQSQNEQIVKNIYNLINMCNQSETKGATESEKIGNSN